MASIKTRTSHPAPFRGTGRSAVADPRSTAAPAQTTFLGREQEITELPELLERERLITLTGAPGIGKSRLGLEMAARMRERYPRGGVRLAELAVTCLPHDVPRAVASVLSIQEVAGQPLTDTLVGRLRGRRLLLVLDNCEHLLSACAELVELLLSDCPKLQVLATSREPLGLAAERVWQVPPLAVPPSGTADASPESLSGYAALALFCERAALAQPGFSLNPYVAPAVTEICQRLDGIPLALELAAARVETLTPQEIARRLDDRCDLLTQGSESALERHQTLAAALDWSHELLSEPERALLRRLSVFILCFEPEAVAAVCAGGEVKREQVPELLEGLAAKSLVMVAESGSAPQARYHLLETIRAYAGERLEEAAETAALRKAHARFYLALAEAAEPELTGPRQQAWLERLEAERANLRSALEWSLGNGDTERALRLAGAVVLFWRVRGHFSEGQKLLDAAVSADEGARPALLARALWGAGFMALLAGDAEGAIGSLGKSLARFRELGDRQGCARALWVLSSCLHQHDDVGVLSLLEESVALARETGDSWCLSHALVLLAGRVTPLYDVPARRGLLEEALAVAREAEDTQSVRFALQALGSFIAHQGDIGAGESLLEESMALSDELGGDYGKATAVQRLGQIAFDRGDFARAGELLDEALALIVELGASLLLPSLLALRARVAHAQSNRHRARLLFEESLTLAPEGNPARIWALRWLGELATEEGDLGMARRLLEESLELGRGRHDKAATADALYALGQLARAEGEPRRAAVLNNEALALARNIGRVSGIIASLEAHAGLVAEGGRHELAARLFGAAKALQAGSGYAGGWRPSRREADLALVREQLSPEQLETAFAEGEKLSLDDATAEAREDSILLGRAVDERWSRLSEREQQVAALAAQGLSNPEIAECLFVSRDTVKFHLARIYRKLGLAGRTELARVVWRSGREPPGDDR